MAVVKLHSTERCRPPLAEKGISSSRILDAAKVPSRCDAERKALIELLVDDEATISAQELIKGGHGVVPLPPGTVGECRFGHFLDDGIEDDQIRVLAYEGRIQFELAEDMLVRVWFESRKTTIRFEPAARLRLPASMTPVSVEEPSMR